MNARRNKPRPFLRRASMLVQGTVFGSMVGVGVAALAVDTGLMFSARTELQTAADAAALAAASQLGSSDDPQSLAAAEAAKFAALNSVAGLGPENTELVFGHAVLDGEKYEFHPNEQPYDAVNVTIRRDATVSDGPVSLLFAKTIGKDSTDLSADATAMLVPRDIAVVIDLSGSMNDDSELRHYKNFVSETDGSTRPGVQINLQEVWADLPTSKGKTGILKGTNPSSPGALSTTNNQPGTGSGTPTDVGGSPNGDGPRWGWMTGFGNSIVLGSYTPVGDPGLYHIPRYQTCTDADVIANLIEAGYSSAERSALLSSSSDGTSSNYQRRVKVMLGLVGWKSGKSGGKYTGTGDGDNIVESGEVTQSLSYPFSSGSWDDWVNYIMSSSTRMEDTDSNFRYRYGIKTFVNYLLETQANHGDCPELADTPEQPLHSVKDAVQAMINKVVELETDDRMSLETFAQYGNHELDLRDPVTGESLAEVLQEIPDTLYGRQAGHYTSVTNIGGGLAKGITELTSARARPTAAKVLIMLTDGKPNVNQYNNYVGDNDDQAINWCLDRANAAKALGMTVYTIGVGGDVNADLLKVLCSGGGEDLPYLGEEDENGNTQNYFFADSAPDPDNGGQPKYMQQLDTIFETLGGRRPVRLIE